VSSIVGQLVQLFDVDETDQFIVHAHPPHAVALSITEREVVPSVEDFSPIGAVPVVVPLGDLEPGTVARIVDEALAEGREHLSEREALAVFECYGIPTIGYRTARDADEAVAAAQELGFPVVMKVLSPDVIHKSDVGGVAVDLRSPEEIREAFQRIMEAVAREVPEARVQGVLLEQFIKGGRETIIGVSHDPAFGPIVMFGLGGIYVEGLKDVVFRVHPVTRGDASEMVRSLRGGRILEGLRGEPGVDFEGLSEVVERVSQLVGDHERIVELDINPFLAFDDGGVAVDARIRVTS